MNSSILLIKTKLNEILKSYPNTEKIIWLQEEPKNMGAWNFLNGRIKELLSEKQKLICVSRPEGASPAVGSGKLSNQQQVDLIQQAFSVNT